MESRLIFGLVLVQVSLYIQDLLCITLAADQERLPLQKHQTREILEVVKSSCYVAATDKAGQELLDDFETLSFIFKDDPGVTFGLIGDISSFKWPDGKHLNWRSSSSPLSVLENDIAVFPKVKVDRTCLSTNLLPTSHYPHAERYVGPRSLPILVEYINSKCHTFRTLQGSLTTIGLHRKYILDNLFHSSEVTNVSIGYLHGSQNSLFANKTILWDVTNKQQKCSLYEERESCESDHLRSKDTCPEKSSISQELQIHQCEEISVPSKETFFHEYLKRSKPVIIKNATNHWPAMRKWTNEFLRREYGNREVHIKLSPGGDYEGVEKAEIWDDFKTFQIPSVVEKQLSFPDLVVVRPAVLEMKFSKFLDMIEHFSKEKGENGTAYLEYSSIPQYMPELENDMKAFPFLPKEFVRKHLNIWLSDGHTLGRLHFDPFDNLLVQISGQKQLLLFDPHDNQRLYEAHIPEAVLSYDEKTRTFHRKSRQDTTSMVMSPVDLKDPDLQRFPLFAEAVPLNCTISEGDVLFMPAFWWHEVQSSPSHSQHRNLAVNFWYEPLLTKEFPCAECKLDVNPTYHHLLQ